MQRCRNWNQVGTSDDKYKWKYKWVKEDDVA